jgi:uncharacterized LabA/DUF88 family protein
MQKTNPKNQKPIYAFIDSQNLNLGIRSQGWQLDFKRFRIYLKDKYKAKKAYLFIGYVKGNETLYTYLQQANYILVFKPTLETKTKGKTIIKGNVDAELVLHAMVEYPHYSKAIIVSGDGDFRCLIEYLDQKNKLIKVIIPNQKKYSSLLLPFKKYMSFTNYLEEKLKKQKKGVLSVGQNLQPSLLRDAKLY